MYDLDTDITSTIPNELDQIVSFNLIAPTEVILVLENTEPTQSQTIVEELFEEVESNYAVTEAYLPNGVKANEALVTLERLANQENVEITSISRASANLAIEEVPVNFLKNTFKIKI